MEIELIFRICFLLLFIAFLGIRAYYGKKSPWTKQTREERMEDLKREGRGSAFVLLGLWLFYMLWIFLYFVVPSLIWWSFFAVSLEWQLLGVVLSILSVPYIMWSHRTLGANFTATIATKEKQSLVKDGPYARVRHPIYSAHTIFNSGVVLLAMNWVFLILLVIGIPYSYRRMFNEEEIMIERFGEEYQTYMGQTGRIFPRIRQSKN